MINTLEKVAVGVCGLFVILTVALYAVLKLPSPRDIGQIEGVRERPRVAEAQTSTTPAPSPTAVDPEVQAVVERLQDQDLKYSVKDIVRKDLSVPGELFEYLDAEANWLPALKTAKSRVYSTRNGNTRLQVYGIQPQSHLNKLGFQDDDVIELINGQIVTFDKSETTRYYELAEKVKQDLREGRSITVTVSRNGRPVHLEYRLGR